MCLANNFPLPLCCRPARAVGAAAQAAAPHPGPGRPPAQGDQQAQEPGGRCAAACEAGLRGGLPCGAWRHTLAATGAACVLLLHSCLCAAWRVLRFIAPPWSCSHHPCLPADPRIGRQELLPGMRRTTRQREAPLKWWLNEKKEFGRQHKWVGAGRGWEGQQQAFCSATPLFLAALCVGVVRLLPTAHVCRTTF